MTEAQWKYLERYIRVLADLMGLKDWTFYLDREPTAPENSAHITCIETRKIGRIQICESFHTFDTDEQRHTIVHELVHPHFEPTRLALDGARELMGDMTYQPVNNAMRNGIEWGVDAMADVFARYMPPCELPTSEASA